MDGNTLVIYSYYVLHYPILLYIPADRGKGAQSKQCQKNHSNDNLSRLPTLSELVHGAV
jgi:hypothetical protein